MQSTIMTVSLILSVIGFMCVHLKTCADKQNLWGCAKKAVLPGAVLGIVLLALALCPFTLSNIVIGILLGILSSEMLYIAYLIAVSVWKEETATYYDDGTSPKYFITGDKHRDFAMVKEFCRNANTRKKDILIILGDAGLNYFGDIRDDKLKKQVSGLSITLFCVHGNKENRPQNVGTYGVRNFCGGKVYYEPKYPNIFFAIDGEVYTFEGKKYMVVGGAHSVDKLRCLEENRPYWEDEMPSDMIKAKVEERLNGEDNAIYGMLTHTCPIDYLPTEMFLSTRRNTEARSLLRKKKTKKRFKPDVDRSTEWWLGSIEKKLDYQVWYCGHYHIDKQVDKVNMMYHEIRPLHLQLSV